MGGWIAIEWGGEGTRGQRQGRSGIIAEGVGGNIV